MKDTGLHVPASKADRFAANHTSRLMVIDHPEKSSYLKPPKMESGGGGLVSTTYVSFR